MPKSIPHTSAEGNGKAHRNGKLTEGLTSRIKNPAAVIDPEPGHPTGNRGTDDVEIVSRYEGLSEAELGGPEESLADVAKRIASLRFLVKGWIPYGMVTGVIAEPGTGKSAFILWIARSILMKKPWFTGDEGPSEPGYVLWCPTESDLAITIDRMTKWKIPMERLMLPFSGDDALRSIDLTSAEDLERIQEKVERYKIKAVFVDSLRGSHDTDENNSRVGKVVKNLAEIAARTQAAVIVVHHTGKLKPDVEMTTNSCRGSNAILANFRSMIGIDKPDPGSKVLRVRVLNKNLAIDPKPIGYQITDKGLTFTTAPERPRKETERDRAEAWLKSNMEPGKWHSCRELLEETDQMGFSRNAVQRAREALGIVKPDYMHKTATGWEWRLPGGSL